jgi:type 1 glutamine amidotransferase
LNAGKTMSVCIFNDEPHKIGLLPAILGSKGSYAFDRINDQDNLPSSFASYDAVIMYVHKTLTEQSEKLLIDYAEGGGRLLVLHHGISFSKRENPRWLHFLGIHLEPRDASVNEWRVVMNAMHTVVNLKPGHFITTNGVSYERNVNYTGSDAPSKEKAFRAYDLLDTEIFLNQHFTDGRSKTVLFGFQCFDPVTKKTINQDRGGWIKHVGLGSTIYLNPGHAPSDYEHPAFSQIIHNCLVWDESVHA